MIEGSEPARSHEDASRDLLDNCGGDYERALERLQNMRENVLDRVHIAEGFDEYKRLKEADNQ